MRMERRVLTATLPKSSVHSSRLPRRRKGRIFFASLASRRSCAEACCAAERARHEAGHGARTGAAERPARSALQALCVALCAARCASKLTSGRSPLSITIRSPTMSRPMSPSVSPEKSADMLRRKSIAMMDAADTIVPGLVCCFPRPPQAPFSTPPNIQSYLLLNNLPGG
jgi:hypothetical protein